MFICMCGIEICGQCGYCGAVDPTIHEKTWKITVKTAPHLPKSKWPKLLKELENGQRGNVSLLPTAAEMLWEYQTKWVGSSPPPKEIIEDVLRDLFDVDDVEGWEVLLGEKTPLFSQ